MKKNLLTLITLFFLISSSSFAQSSCDCKEFSNDKLEKLTALTVKGNDQAYQYYLSEIKSNIEIDNDLKIALEIIHNQSPSYWNQISYLKDRVSFLMKKRNGFLGLGGKKSPEEYDNIYWIKTKRLGCFENIVKQLQSMADNSEWGKANKSERKKQAINDANTKIENASKDKQPSTKTENTTTTQSNEEVIKKLEEFIKQQEAKSTNQGTTTTTVQGESAKNNIETYIIYFSEGEIKLDSKALETLKSIIQTISSRTVTEIRIEGFASQTGSRETNFAISMSRCYEVKKAIQAGGYNSDFTILPYGETDNKDFRAVVITLRGK